MNEPSADAPSHAPVRRACGTAAAQVCDECRRACALKAFADISRHPESISPGDTACLVCEDGPASWCGSCWAVAVAEQRTMLREQSGRDIGRWPDYPERLRWEEELLRQQRVARDDDGR